ncbi:locomotion-related protein Hikaru genki-like [Ciona intestinalis]
MKMCSLPHNVAGLKEAGGDPLQQAYNAQTTVRFACLEVNQVLQGNDFANCLVNQNWDRPFPTCVRPAGFCPLLQAPANGQISLSKRINIPGTLATFNCDNGYNRIGPRRLLCQATYQWSYTAPTCRIQGCTIFLPPNGIIVPVGIEHAVGTSVEVECSAVQTLSGSPTTITCLGQDRWSHDLNGYSCT